MKKVTRKSIKQHQLKKRIVILTLLLTLIVPAAASAMVTYTPHGQWTMWDTGWWFWGSKTAYSNYYNNASYHGSGAEIDGNWHWGYSNANRWSYGSVTGRASSNNVDGDIRSYGGGY